MQNYFLKKTNKASRLVTLYNTELCYESVKQSVIRASNQNITLDYINSRLNILSEAY